MPITGLLQKRANEVVVGANAYISSINDAGGVNGRKIDLTVCDDLYDPEKAILCFTTCLKNKVFAGFLAQGSAAIAKYVRMADVEHLPMLGYITGVPVIYETHKTQFTIRPSITSEVHAAVMHACAKLGMKRIAVIYQDDAYGAAIRQGTIDALKQLGLAPVAEASYMRNGAELAQALDRAKNGNPDLVICGATAGRLIELIKRRDEIQFQPHFLVLSMAADYLVADGKAADGVIITRVWPSYDEHVPAADLFKKVMKKYAAKEPLSQSAYEGFLNAIILCEGLKLAGKDLTREKFITALESMHNFDLGLGANYTVHFGPGKHDALGSSVIYFNVMKGGVLVNANDQDWKPAK
jgi:ABC-type branched-subunit amino acid transport system substrate-binding protein